MIRIADWMHIRSAVGFGFSFTPVIIENPGNDTEMKGDSLRPLFACKEHVQSPLFAYKERVQSPLFKCKEHVQSPFFACKEYVQSLPFTCKVITPKLLNEQTTDPNFHTLSTGKNRFLIYGVAFARVCVYVCVFT